MIGVARLMMNPDLTSGGLAVLLHDRFQGKGLGHKLVEVLIEIAREKGLEDIRAEVLTENKRMLTVLRRLGFTTQWLPGGTSEAVLKLKE
jgi:acetyltransferase